MGRFTANESLIIDHEPFRDDWRPPDIIGREDSINKLVQSYRQTAFGNGVPNLLVYGDRGTGKSLVTGRLLEELKADAAEQGVDVYIISINCQSVTTSYQIGTAICNDIRTRLGRSTIAKRGLSTHEVVQQMFSALDDLGGNTIVILDEIENLTDAEILYHLSRARSHPNPDLTSARVGVLGITNDYRFERDLPADVRGGMYQRTVQFSPYEPQTLEKILADRVDRGLRDDAFGGNEEARAPLRLASAIAGRDSGSARQAISLVYEAANLAYEHGASQLREEHIKAAQDELEINRLAEQVETMTHQVQLALVAVVAATTDESYGDRFRVPELFELYQTITEEANLGQIQERAFREKLMSLHRAGIVEYDEVRSDGRHYQFHLDPSVDTILQIILEEEILLSSPEVLLKRGADKYIDEDFLANLA